MEQRRPRRQPLEFADNGLMRGSQAGVSTFRRVPSWERGIRVQNELYDLLYQGQQGHGMYVLPDYSEYNARTKALDDVREELWARGTPVTREDALAEMGFAEDEEVL